jgi:modulator of FtsH protease HflK
MIAGSMLYTVQAEYQGIVLRFGKYIKTVEPGLHFKLPLGIDEVHLVPVRRQLKQEFGFGTPGATSSMQYASSRAEQEGERNMVTGDLNSATVEWIIQFRITDPQQYLFRVRNPEITLRNISESVMRAVVGDRSVDEVITVGRQEIESVALIQMQEVVNLYQLGLIIDQVQLKDVNPPRKVQPSFNEVNQAQQERERMINIANGEYNRVIPHARGEAEQVIQEAEGYALRRINRAQGEIARFNAVLEEYSKAPAVTRQRLYLETLATVIPNLGSKIVIDHEATQILPLLQLHEGDQQ